MILETLRTRNFRNLAGKNPLHFHDRLSLLVGDNGEGKTSVLEAIYFLGTTKSFRTKRLGNLFAFGEQQLFVEATTREEEIERTLSVGLEETDRARRRQLLVNGQPATLREFVTSLPIVAFSAARLDILLGGPDERRRFLDRGIATLQPGYLATLSRYQRLVRQRNALLQEIAKHRRRAEELEPWDDQWITASVEITRSRRDYCSLLGKALSGIIETYRYPINEVTLDYRPGGGADEAEQAEALDRTRARELSAGFTLTGPHRDDLEMTFRDHPAREILSAGEGKALVLFLKMAKIALITETLKRTPLFLLDDVDAELDVGMVERVLGDVRGRAQVFTTSSKGSIFDGMAIGDFRKYRVHRGVVSDAGQTTGPGS